MVLPVNVPRFSLFASTPDKEIKLFTFVVKVAVESEVVPPVVVPVKLFICA